MNIHNFSKFPYFLKFQQHAKQILKQSIFPILLTSFIIINLYNFYPQALPPNLVPAIDKLMLQISGIYVQDSIPFATQANKENSITFDTNYYPYYGLLNANEKKLYKQIYENTNQLCATFVPSAIVTIEETTNAIEAVFNDHPELFWLETTYGYCHTNNKRCVAITLQFNDTINDFENAKAQFHNSTSAIINAANKLGSDYEKEKYVHDALLSLITYDASAEFNQSAYSALIDGTSVCAGYSRAFQYIMTELGIPTYYCLGSFEEEHAWNIVKLDDEYYNVDLTGDDESQSPYHYFNRTDDDFSSTHTRLGTSVNLPACTATKYRGPE